MTSINLFGPPEDAIAAIQRVKAEIDSLKDKTITVGGPIRTVDDLRKAFAFAVEMQLGPTSRAGQQLLAAAQAWGCTYLIPASWITAT